MTLSKTRGLRSVNQNSNGSQSQDVIIQEPELVRTTFDPSQISLLQTPRYLDLVRIIHEKGPLTLGEMAAEYAKLEKDVQAKSDSTVYRYLTLLKESNLVQEAGQRISEGKIHSRTLYSLPARYLIIDEAEIAWESSYGQGIFKNLVTILKILDQNKPIDEPALFQWQLAFQRSVDEDKQRLIKSKDPEILEILAVWGPYSIYELMEYLGWISFLIKDPKAQEAFLKCFSNSVELEAPPSSVNTEQTEAERQTPHRDIIRQNGEILYGLLDDDPRRPYLEKPAYLPLFYVLRDRPMTIEELVEKYNQVAFVPRQKSTIYRYVKTLKEAVLVLEVGQRVTHGKKTIQKLYGPIGRVISIQGKYEPEWRSEPREWLLEAVMTMLNFLFPELPKIDKEKFREFRAMGSQHEQEGNRRFQLPENRRILELLHKCDWKTFYQMYTTFWDYYYFTNIPNLYDRLQKCFSE
jgi:Fe2+ or Zn2+ uptake regulation protein